MVIVLVLLDQYSGRGRGERGCQQAGPLVLDSRGEEQEMGLLLALDQAGGVTGIAAVGLEGFGGRVAQHLFK